MTAAYSKRIFHREITRYTSKMYRPSKKNFFIFVIFLNNALQKSKLIINTLEENACAPPLINAKRGV